MNKKIKKYREYYESGFWTKAAVRQLVETGKITEVEYAIITGEPYEESDSN